MTTAAVSVGCGAGFAGDRLEPAVELAASGLVDWVGLECLAERTLVHGLTARIADANRGYDPRLERRLTPLLPVATDRGCGIVTNLGAANPMAAGRAVADLARRLELGGLRVAVITGDDVLDRVDRVVWWGTGAPADGEWLGAHAYLGIEKMVTAVAEGAQVVVTGRVADSALFAAPLLATWADGAGRAGDDGLLAAALALGHLLECGGQLTGGNLAAWQGPELGPSDLADLGYPLATLRADGTAEVRVLPGKPARLDPLTCTLQLLYEVHDPAHYATPDAVMDLSAVEFAATPDGAVTVSGVRCRPRPADLKVVGFLRRPGVVADVEIGYAGIGALDRARQAADTVRHRLERLGLCEARVDIVGVDSILGGATATVAPPAEVRAHVSVRCPDDDVAQAVEDEVYALTLCGPAGGAALRSERRPHIEVRSGGIARGQVDQHVEWVS